MRCRSLCILVIVIGCSILTVSKSFSFARIPVPGRRENNHRLLQMSAESSSGGGNEGKPHLVYSLVDYLKNNDGAPKLILASQSPRRREILNFMGLEGLYDVEPSPCDETKLQKELQGMDPIEYTRRLAEAKASALAEERYTGSSDHILFLGSDTIVEMDDKILEKPKDLVESKKMITRLSGNSHHVHTGVAIYKMKDGQLSLCESFVDTASVTFASIGEKDIDAYVNSKEGMDKAGKVKSF